MPGGSDSAFIALESQYEAARKHLAARSSRRNDHDPFYAVLKTYAENIDPLNLPGSLKKNTTRKLFSELTAAARPHDPVFAAFIADEFSVFHKDVSSILRYASLRTAFLCTRDALLNLAHCVAHRESAALVRSYLDESDYALSRNTPTKRDAVSSAALIRKMNDFIERERIRIQRRSI